MFHLIPACGQGRRGRLIVFLFVCVCVYIYNFILFFKLEDNCFITLHWFLPYIITNQS